MQERERERERQSRGGFRQAYDVLAHAGFADIDAEFEQFAVDAGCTPQWILSAHLPNQLPNFFR